MLFRSVACDKWSVKHLLATHGHKARDLSRALESYRCQLCSAGWPIDYRHTFGKWTVRKHVFLHIIVHCPVFQKQGTNWESDGVDRVKVLVDEGAHSMNVPPKCLLLRASSEQQWQKCTGMTQRDGMGREVGGGFRMGNTCTPVADSC